MKITTVDSETTGLDPKVDKLLELGVVLYDPKDHGTTFNAIDFASLPNITFRLIHDLGDTVYHEVVEKMNARLLQPLRDKVYEDGEGYKYVRPEELQGELLKFLFLNKFIDEDEFVNGKISKNKLNILGKNFAMFDRKFLEEVIDFGKIRHRQRILDPGILFTDVVGDSELPNLKQCMDRSYVFDANHPVAHTAYEDSLDTLKLTLSKLLDH